MLGHACDLRFIQSLPVSHSHSASLPNNVCSELCVVTRRKGLFCVGS